MPATLYVTSEDDTGNNEALDALLVLRAVMAFDTDSSPTEAEIASFNISPHRFIHVEKTEPTDFVQPQATVVLFADLDPPSRLMFKVKDDVGLIRMGSINLTP